MNWKKFRKILGATVVSLALVSGPAITANADTTGGMGGGGGGGGAYSGFEWVSIAGNKGAVYDEFVKKSKWGSQTDSIVNARIGGNGVGICRDSNAIWFIRSAQGGWTYNYTGGTHGSSSGNVQGSIEKPYSAYGDRRPIAEEVQAFKDWDGGQNGGRIDNVPGYTIICSGKFMQPDITWSTWPSSSTTSSTSASYREPYSYVTTATRQALKDDGGKDIIGEDNLHAQSSVQKTEYGKIYDSINTAGGQGISPADLKSKVDAALAIDANADRPKIDLDDANKKGMAEGGILNMTSFVKYANISTQESTTTTTSSRCDYRMTWNSYWAVYNSASVNCGSTVSTASSRNSQKDVDSTQQVRNFWQMLSVHCNEAEYKALLNSDPSLIEISGPDPSRSISGVVRTQNYAGVPLITDFAPSDSVIPIKGKPLPPAAKIRTGELGFYDKECPFDCTPSNNSADGASKANGALSNVVKTPSVLPGTLFGATTDDKTNSNAFEFFRDNAAKSITVNTWYPKSGNGVAYAGEAPVTTTVARDITGTPSVDGSGGGKFTMKATNGEAMFTGGTKAPSLQKNWDTSTFSSPAMTILKGLNNKITVQSTWASDAGKPQAFNFKWEYAPNVNTTVPLKLIGFGPGGSQVIGTLGSATTPIEGKCYTYFGKSPADPVPSTVTDFGANTGSETINNLDAGLLTGPRGNDAKMTANFVRSTTE